MNRTIAPLIATLTVAASTLAFASLLPSEALAWEFFRSENDHIADGNELLRAGDHEGALREYDLAARELPSEPGVHLDRGLALLAAGDYGRAREALLMAADPPASAEIRAMAQYNIGLSYYREGDALSSGTAAPAPAAPSGPLAGLGGLFGGGAAPTPAPGAPAEPDHDGARRAFREAADAFRDSLRQVPGNRDAGWNLELALRRITEEDEAEERENEENEANEESEENSEDGEEGEESEEGEEGEDGEPGEPNSEGGENGDEESDSGEESGDEGEEPGDSGSEEEDGEGNPGEDGANDGSEESEESGSEESGDPTESGSEGGDGGETEGEGSETEAGGTHDRSLSPDAERVLDALENGEENLAAARARGRGEHASRRVERDW